MFLPLSHYFLLTMRTEMSFLSCKCCISLYRFMKSVQRYADALFWES